MMSGGRVADMGPGGAWQWNIAPIGFYLHIAGWVMSDSSQRPVNYTQAAWPCGLDPASI